MKIVQRLWMILPLLMLAQAAHAVAPANSTITNTATLTYTGNTTGITASVDVLVTLKPAQPTLTVPGSNTQAEGQKSVATYTIKANTNGPETYTLSSSTAPTTNVTGAITVTFKDVAGGVVIPASELILGATAANATVTGATGTTTINVPYDGSTATAGSINGIIVGDKVLIGAGLTAYTVTGVTETTATNTYTITIDAAVTVNAGDLIAEQKTFITEIANVGVRTDGALAADIGVTVSVATPNAPSLTGAIHTTNVVQLTLDKYVRNVSVAGSNPATGPVLIGAFNYYPTQGTLVSSTSGDTLEYAIRIVTPLSVGIAAGATVTDAVPTFTTYVANSTRLNGITVNGDGGTSPLVGGLLVDHYTTRAAGAVALGAVAVNKTVVVTFQVTVD